MYKFHATNSDVDGKSSKQVYVSCDYYIIIWFHRLLDVLRVRSRRSSAKVAVRMLGDPHTALKIKRCNYEAARCVVVTRGGSNRAGALQQAPR